MTLEELQDEILKCNEKYEVIKQQLSVYLTNNTPSVFMTGEWINDLQLDAVMTYKHDMQGCDLSIESMRIFFLKRILRALGNLSNKEATEHQTTIQNLHDDFNKIYQDNMKLFDKVKAFKSQSADTRQQNVSQQIYLQGKHDAYEEMLNSAINNFNKAWQDKFDKVSKAYTFLKTKDLIVKLHPDKNPN